MMPVAAAASIGGLCFVRGAAVGAAGPVRSVLLVSEQPLESLEEISLDLSSRTSVLLARLIVRMRCRGAEPRWYGRRPQDALALVGGRRGAVIIGDPALRIEHAFPHVIDLAQAWFEWTGLPFVFAAWCGRPGVLPPQAEERLVAAKTQGLSCRRQLAEDYAAAMGLDAESLYSYLTDSLTYDFDEPERAGLNRFFKEAAQARLLPATSVRFFDEDRPHALSVSPPGVSASAPRPRAGAGQRLSTFEAECLLREGDLCELEQAALEAMQTCRSAPAAIFHLAATAGAELPAVKAALRPQLDALAAAGADAVWLIGAPLSCPRLAEYEALLHWIRVEFSLGVHGLSPSLVLRLAAQDSLAPAQILERLQRAGLVRLDGGDAALLVDRLLRQSGPVGSAEEWLGVMRTAHHLGLRATCALGWHPDATAHDAAKHLIKLRDLQDETAGFCAFYLLDSLAHVLREPARSAEERLRLRRHEAVARLVLDNIDHVGARVLPPSQAAGPWTVELGQAQLPQEAVRSARGLRGGSRHVA